MGTRNLRFGQVVFANPGFAVIEALCDEQGCPAEINQIPVIAWVLEEVSYAPYPVTLEGVRVDPCYILRPDGKVEQPCSSLFASSAEWLSWHRDQHAKDGRKVG